MRTVTYAKSKVKVGDKIVQYTGPQTNRRPCRILTVQRVTKTLVICGDGYHERISMRFGSPGPATAQELAEARAYFDEKNAERQAAERKQADLEADPHYQLVRRLRNGDFEPWDKLTLEQLRSIAAMLDAVDERNHP